MATGILNLETVPATVAARHGTAPPAGRKGFSAILDNCLESEPEELPESEQGIPSPAPLETSSATPICLPVFYPGAAEPAAAAPLEPLNDGGLSPAAPPAGEGCAAGSAAPGGHAEFPWRPPAAEAAPGEAGAGAASVDESAGGIGEQPQAPAAILVEPEYQAPPAREPLPAVRESARPVPGLDPAEAEWRREPDRYGSAALPTTGAAPGPGAGEERGAPEGRGPETSAGRELPTPIAPAAALSQPAVFAPSRAKQDKGGDGHAMGAPKPAPDVATQAGGESCLKRSAGAVPDGQAAEWPPVAFALRLSQAAGAEVAEPRQAGEPHAAGAGQTAGPAGSARPSLRAEAAGREMASGEQAGANPEAASEPRPVQPGQWNPAAAAVRAATASRPAAPPVEERPGLLSAARGTVPAPAPGPNAADSPAPSQADGPAAAAEPAEPAEPRHPAAPVRTLTLRVEAQDQRIDIRMGERAGEIRVAVHAGEGELRRSLQDGLPELVRGLERQGFSTETWRGDPERSGTRDSGAQDAPHDGPDGGRGGAAQDGRGRRRSPHPGWQEEIGGHTGEESERSASSWQ